MSLLCNCIRDVYPAAFWLMFPLALPACVNTNHFCRCLVRSQPRTALPTATNSPGKCPLPQTQLFQNIFRLRVATATHFLILFSYMMVHTLYLFPWWKPEVPDEMRRWIIKVKTGWCLKAHLLSPSSAKRSNEEKNKINNK